MADFTVITKGGSVYKMTPYKHAVCTLQYDRVGVSRLTEVGSPNMRTFGAPDTVRLPVQTGKKNMITLTEKMQIWMYQLCRERVPSMPEADAKKSWRSLLSGAAEGNSRTARAFSNFTGSNTNADYINRANLDADPIKIDFVLCGGARLMKIERDNRKTITSQACWKVAAIDPLSDFTQYHPSTHPHLFFFPTVSVRIPVLDRKGSPNGQFIEYVSEPFPQFDNRAVMPIWGQPGEPFVYVPEDRISLVPTAGLRSPFRRTTERDPYHDYSTYPYPNPYL